MSCRGLCPEGWSAPATGDFGQLESFLGNYVGGKLKSMGTIENGDGLWYSPNAGATNESGFSGLPGGNRTPPGSYTELGEAGYFWTTSEGFEPSRATTTYLNYNSNDIGYIDTPKENNLSVRCLADEVIEGCTHPNASNYDEEANVDDGSCCIELWGECYNIEGTIYLNKDSQGLIGEIPAAIGNLTNLIYLGLGFNQLSGEIPVEIGDLIYLNELDLQNNQLTGEIPSEIGNLIYLDLLSLQNNQLTGEIPSEIGNLESIGYIKLSNNQLTGEIPSEIGNLMQYSGGYCNPNEEEDPAAWPCDLYFLDLSNNQLSGSIPIELNQLISLENLNLSNNQLSGSIPDLSNITNLTFLDLSNNQLTGEIPSQIGNDGIYYNATCAYGGWNGVCNLRELNLSNNQLSGEIPEEIGDYSGLISLILNNNQLTGEIPPEIGNLTNLEFLYLSDNQLTGEVPEEICNQEYQLNNLNLENNQLCPPYPECFEGDAGEQNLTECDIYSGPTWYVSTDGTDANGYGSEEYPFNSIQYAIDSASEGDSILVSAGTYYENINFNGKNISVIGEDRETTIIDGGGNGTVVTFESGETENTLLSQFTVTNGLASSTNTHTTNKGGGILCLDSSPKIYNNIISNNVAPGPDNCGYGGGIFAYDSSPIIDSNIIRNNTGYCAAGGLGFDGDSDAIVINNLIHSNNVVAGEGAGIYISGLSWGAEWESSNLQIINNTIVQNTAAHRGGGIYHTWHNSGSNIINTIIVNNFPDDVMGPIDTSDGWYFTDGWVDGYESIQSVTYSNIDSIDYSNDTYFLDLFENSEGNINENPQFTDPDNGDYTLQPSSPCIDAGDPESELDPDGTRADMGVYPFFQIPGCTDIESCNYDAEANINDGSCIYNSGTWYVSTDGDNDNCGSEEQPHSSIQFAIDSASEGDTVLVNPGTYNYPDNYSNGIVIADKNITLASMYLLIQDESYIDETIINCLGGCYSFNNSQRMIWVENSSSEINGFSISNGRGIKYNWSTGMIKNSKVHDNHTPDSVHDGGALNLHHSTMTIENCDFHENVAYTSNNGGEGAAIALHSSILDISNSSIYNNEANQKGGGISSYLSTINMDNVNLYNNIANDGGAIFLLENSSINITNSIIEDNIASNRGGGIKASNSSIIIDNSDVLNNQTNEWEGGGLFLSNSFMLLNNSNVSFNSANTDGGGIYSLNSQTFILDSEFENNSAGQKGGGLYLENPQGGMQGGNGCPEMCKTTISSNSSNMGGGIYIKISEEYEDDEDSFDLSNMLIVNNNASIGGGIYYKAGSQSVPWTTVSNITLMDNDANNHKGIYVDGWPTFEIRNSIIRDNLGGDGIYFNYYQSGACIANHISYTNVNEVNYLPSFIDYQCNYDTMIDSDPMLNDNYTLQSNSPCIDMGDPNSPLDSDGTRADMGAYPYEQYQNTIDLHFGANLVSFYAIPNNNSLDNIFAPIDGIVTGVIGEGEAASPNPVLGWVGSLTEIEPDKGYWVKVNDDVILPVTGFETDENIVYGLNYGANLISYPFEQSQDISPSISEEYNDYITGIIGEGVAASYNPTLGWIGSLSAFYKNRGYWFRTNEALDFSYQQAETSSRESDVSVSSEYNQSTQQAFYFIEDIENIEVGDIIKAYHGNVLVGSRAWNGEHTDIPAMGNDNSEYSAGYLNSGDIPVFKVEKLNGEVFSLSGDIPTWNNNEIFMVSTLSESVIIPENYSLQSAYPNPFNPTTTISFQVPYESNVVLNIYDISGRQIRQLANNYYNPGYHSVTWDASDISSGVYFVKMSAGSFSANQKLMLIK